MVPSVKLGEECSQGPRLFCQRVTERLEEVDDVEEEFGVVIVEVLRQCRLVWPIIDGSFADGCSMNDVEDIFSARRTAKQ